MPEKKLRKETIQMVIFQLADEEFAVPIEQVREVAEMMPITRMPNVPDFIEGVINLRGNILPIIDLKKRLALPSTENNEGGGIMWVEIAGQQLGMIVDKVSEVMEIPIKDIDSTPSLIASEIDTGYISGVAKLDETGERLLILLDLELILSHKEKTLLDISTLNKEQKE